MARPWIDLTAPALSFGPFRLQPTQQLLLEGDASLALGSRALDILCMLVERAGELVTKEELVSRVWPDTAVDESNLRAQVAALRKALRDGRDGARYVATVPGRGYRFVAPVSRSTEPVAREELGARAQELPARLTRAVGRDEVVAAIGARLQRRRFITVVGPAGIGKTTVALAVAEALSVSYEHGAAYLDLASSTDERLVPSALASALGLASVSGDPTPTVVALLRDRRLLVVLDSCEHVVEAAAVLAEQLLKRAPGVHLLATSREPLRAEGESVHRLSPLEVPPISAELTAAEALTFSSVELFVERAAACVDGFALSDADAPLVAEICRRLDGIALAIELVAGRLDAFGVAGVAAHLDDRFRLLTSGRRTALPRHQTLSAALDWSYEFLPEAERALLRRLAILSGGFTLEMASAVAGDASSSAAEIVDGVASLVAKSLIAADVSGAAGSYRLLDTTRAYALAKLVESGEREPIARRHAEHILVVLERAAAEWQKGRPLAEWLASYGRQIDNVRLALDWAFSPPGDAAIGVRLTVAAIPLWFQLPLIDECFSRVQQALTSADPGPSRDAHARQAMQLLGALGLSRALATGFAPEAVAAFARALEIAESLGDIENQLGMLYGLWTCRFATGEYRSALALGQRFGELAETTADPADRLIGERLIGIPMHYLGDHVEARRHLEHMLGHYVAPTNRPPTIRFQSDQRVLARATLAQLLWLQGFPDQATREAQRTIEEAQATGHAISLYGALAQAECPVAFLVGDLATAERSVAMLLQHAATHPLGPWSVLARAFHGVLMLAQGELEKGLLVLRAALAEYAQSPHLRINLTLLAALAEGCGRAGALAGGLAAIDEALERSERQEERWYTAELLRIEAGLLLAQGAPDAEARFLESLDAARRQQALAWELRTATSLAGAWRDRGRAAEARDLLAPVYGRFREGFASADLVAAKRLLDAL